jgi:hypothetical protein
MSTLSDGNYAVNWVYRAIDRDAVYITLGTGNHTLAEAQAEVAPVIFPHAIGFSMLVAKVIIQKGATTVTSITSAFSQNFAQPIAHNSLDGVNSGDYQHLTAAELLEVQNMDTNYVATDSLVTTLLDYVTNTSLGTTLAGYALLNGDSDEDFAAKHFDADTATFTTSVQVGTVVDLEITGDGAGNSTFDTAVATFTGQVDIGNGTDLTVTGDGSGNVTLTAASIDIVADFTVNGEDVLGDISAALAAILGD